MKFKRYIVIEVDQDGRSQEYTYKYSEDDLLKIPEYARMNRLRKIRPMIDFGFCEGTMGTMVIDSHHENLNTLYKEVLDNIKFQARDQRLAKLLDDLGC